MCKIKLFPYLHVDELLDVLVSVRLPLVEAVHLVEGDDERSLLVLQKVDRLYRLQCNNPDSATNFEY